MGTTTTTAHLGRLDAIPGEMGRVPGEATGELGLCLLGILRKASHDEFSRHAGVVTCLDILPKIQKIAANFQCLLDVD